MLLAAFCLSMAGTVAMAQTATLTGTVTHDGNNEVLPGVTIYFPDLKTGTVTDEGGQYIIDGLPVATVTVQVTYVGHQTIVKDVDLRHTTSLDFVMKESNAMINEVVVTAFTGTSQLRSSSTPVNVVSKRQLHAIASTNIIDALAQQPGMSQLTTGGAISKPIIRGLGYNRVAVVSDGIRQEGQQWGDEHGIEVDADRVQSAEVLKGPASLMYGSDAMAGVLVLNNMPELAKDRFVANLSTQYQTNNGLWDYSLNVAGNKTVLWDLRYSERMAHAYKNRYDGHVTGSQFHQRALAGIVGVSRKWGSSTLSLNYFHLTPSIVEGERDSSTGDLVVPWEGYHVKTYHKALPFQQIHHVKAVIDNSIFVGNGRLKFILGFQHNQRQEFEEEPDEAELDFRLCTVNYDLRYVLGTGGWKIATGANGMWQQSLNRGEEVLIPEYKLLDIGVFATATRQVEKWSLSGGLRFDNRHLHGMAHEDIFTDFSRDLRGVTGSVGAVFHATDRLNFRMNASRGFRAPNMSELASNGVHEGSLRYELGDHNLKSEFSWQFDLGADYSSSVISAQASLFLNLIDNYIFMKRLADVETEGYQTYQYTSGNARLWGGEFTVDIHPVEPLHFENSLGFVDARLLNQPLESRYLPCTPPLRWMSELRYDIIRDGHALTNTYAAINIDCNAKQNRYLMEGESETATPAYCLLGASLGTMIKHRGKVVASITIIGDNLLDKAYQSHLSRLKYADVNAVTGRMGVFNMGRNFTFKLDIPLVF